MWRLLSLKTWQSLTTKPKPGREGLFMLGSLGLQANEDMRHVDQSRHPR